MRASYEVGKLVRGTVTQLANFGAFARIEDGIEGLIHVSELADERIQHPKQVVSEGQELLLRIIRIDPQRRRMGLSLRRALDTPDDELISVFGEGILEERDALSQKIKDALEAEGLTGQFAEPREEDEVRPSWHRASRGSCGAGARVASIRSLPSKNASSAPKRPLPHAAARRAAPAPGAAPESSAFEGEEMSAMAMAFALAGARGSKRTRPSATSRKQPPTLASPAKKSCRRPETAGGKSMTGQTPLARGASPSRTGSTGRRGQLSWRRSR